MGLAWLFGLSHDSILAFGTRAVTTPIAIGIGEKIHAPIALAAALVGFSGVLGAAVAEPLLKGVKSDVARGFAMGWRHMVSVPHVLSRFILPRVRLLRWAWG